MEEAKKVRDAQLAILSRLAECETKAGALYKAYASAFPAMAAFWNRIAEEEEGHARMLLGLRKQVDTGHLFFGVGRFTGAEVERLEAIIANGLEAASEGKCSMQQAITTALSIESSMIDGHSYDVVTSDAPEFKTIADSISKATARHREMIRDRMMDALIERPSP